MSNNGDVDYCGDSFFFSHGSARTVSDIKRDAQVGFMRQVYTQWRTHATAGLSKWLFIGQLAASAGYTVYSFLLHNWVFATSNIAILLTAVVGEGLYLRNRRGAS